MTGGMQDGMKNVAICMFMRFKPVYVKVRHFHGDYVTSVSTSHQVGRRRSAAVVMFSSLPSPPSASTASYCEALFIDLGLPCLLSTTEQPARPCVHLP